MAHANVLKKAVFFWLLALVFFAAMLFIPAGTLDYWQGWLYMAVLFVPVSFVMLYFLKSDPEFLERRFRTREKEARQQLVVKATGIIFFIGFLIPGLDRRFGWSQMPAEVSLVSACLVLMGYAIVFIVFRENSYAGRTVEVEKGQKVISTGPYSVVRHPMYLGVIVLYVATPFALGSYWALPLFILIAPFLVIRIINEEEVLSRDLPGYGAYLGKVKYRLFPYVW
ncbi:MAG: isoprenylcysteine carboxylmethyltransferase family protein [Candidatus Micrarchaeia archaeon]